MSASYEVKYVIQNPTAKKIRYRDACEGGYSLHSSPYPYFYLSQEVWEMWGQPMELRMSIQPADLGADPWKTPEEILIDKTRTNPEPDRRPDTTTGALR